MENNTKYHYYLRTVENSRAHVSFRNTKKTQVIHLLFPNSFFLLPLEDEYLKVANFKKEHG